MQLSELLSRRKDELVTVLRESDARTQEAALRTLVKALRTLPSKCQASNVRDVAEHIGQLSLKGFNRPIDAYEVLSWHSRPSAQPSSSTSPSAPTPGRES